MQKLVFFIDQTDNCYGSLSTVGNSYMNRFAIDEDAGHEIVNIHEAAFSFLTWAEKEQQGTDQIISSVNSHDEFVKFFCFVKLT